MREEPESVAVDPEEDVPVHRLEYSVRTRATIDQCWQAYTDWQNWHRFHPSYGKRQWTDGEPWTVGSRLAIEITSPIHFNVVHVITRYSPKECIAWIDHSGFITIEQWVYFRKHPDGGTLIETWADLVGPSTFKGMLAMPLFRSFTRKWYDEFAHYCDTLPIT